MTRRVILRATVSDPREGRFFRVGLTHAQATRHDNGALVSLGLMVGRDLHAATLARWIKAGWAQEITRDEWSHSGCQSSCVRRGGERCTW